MFPTPVPLYEQIKQHVLRRIATGELRPGEKIASENQLAAELGTSRLTANRALRELTASGVLQRIAGVGTFVAPPKGASTFVLVHNIADEIRNNGEVLSIRVIRLERVTIGPELAGHFMLPLQSTLFHSVLIYSANGLPIQLEDRYVSPDFAPNYLDQLFETNSTTDYLQHIAVASRTENRVSAALPAPEEADFLGIQNTQPCLVVERKTWVGSAVTTYTRFVHPGHRHSLVTREVLSEY